LYFPWDLDDQVPVKVAEIERLDHYDAPMVLEGGSFNVDGEGTLLTTEECLLSPGRNPSLSKTEIETHLSNYLNVEKIIWLAKGVDPDETNGHVDEICCFARPGAVFLHWTDDPRHPHYDIVHDAYERLIHEKDAHGRTLKIYKLYGGSPRATTKEETEGIDYVKGTKHRQEGEELDLSYINFFIANNGVVLPAFGDKNDSLAVETLSDAFPCRKVVSVPNAFEIALAGGNIHCITQQQPRG
jgi:agmatine deiminase